MKPFLPSILAGAAGLLALSAHAAPPYSITDRWSLGEPSKWDYTAIDAARQRLYVTRGERVQVVDMASGRVTGEIPGTSGVHGVAFAPDLKLGFTSNGKSNSITVFDLDSLAVRQQVSVAGVNPDAILYEAQSHKLYAFNGKSANVSVFDARTLKPLASIQVGGKPEFAVSDGKGKIYFNLEDTGEVGVLDVASNTLAARWKLPGCEEPSGLALDAVHGRLFSVCANKVMAVTDAASGRQVAALPIGGHADAVVYDGARGMVLSSNGDGTLSVIHQTGADGYAPAVTVATEAGARTLALNAASGQVYLPLTSGAQFKVLVLTP